MERLWAPWRLAYVTAASGEPTDCIFCSIFDPARGDLIVARGRLSFVILNLYPYNNGHLMVVPNRHVPNLASMRGDELAELMQLTRRSEMVLNEAYKPQGINVGINLGRPAGAGVADHLHVHLVPRWNGDTNFMTVVGNVRVVPEPLDATKAKLAPIFERLANSGE
ncbi:MAG TPA: HIT domain-containing protein [Vicinamibacterales bacterium]|nr:HIT domain-containing protein [Vicinamibacterales bacterium]